MSGLEGLETSVPEELTPFRFRLARVRGEYLLFGLFVIWAVGVLIGWNVYILLGGPTPSLLTIIGNVSYCLAVGVLGISIWVGMYSKKQYLDNYRARAKKLYANQQEQQPPPEAYVLDLILSDFHGVLKSKTSKVLTSDVGATLIAVGAILNFVGVFVKP
jgi:hypothetical protein